MLGISHHPLSNSGMEVQLPSLPHWHPVNEHEAPSHIKWVYKLSTLLGSADTRMREETEVDYQCCIAILCLNVAMC